MSILATDPTETGDVVTGTASEPDISYSKAAGFLPTAIYTQRQEKDGGGGPHSKTHHCNLWLEI